MRLEIKLDSVLVFCLSAGASFCCELSSANKSPLANSSPKSSAAAAAKDVPQAKTNDNKNSLFMLKSPLAYADFSDSIVKL